MIFGLIKQKKQSQQMGYASDILSQAMAPYMTEGIPGTPGLSPMGPSPGGLDVTIPGLPSIPGLEGRMERPTALPPDILSRFMTDPRLSGETKMMAPKLLEQFQPQKKEYLTLGPGQEATELTTGKKIKGPATEGKRHVLKEGDTLVDDEGKIIAEGPAKKEKPKLVTVSPGQKIVDEEGTVKFEMPEKEEGAPPIKTYKSGKEEISVQWDPKLKKYVKIATAPRKTDEELKATKAKELRDIVGQRFGFGKDKHYENLDERMKFKHDTVFEEAQKYSHKMDTGAAVNRAMKEFKESKKIKLYEREATLNPETKKWEYPEGKGYTDRWKYEGEQTWREPEGKQLKPLDEAIARAILKEAGGDKNKAREIAKQRGYKF